LLGIVRAWLFLRSIWLNYIIFWLKINTSAEKGVFLNPLTSRSITFEWGVVKGLVFWFKDVLFSTIKLLSLKLVKKYDGTVVRSFLGRLGALLGGMRGGIVLYI
jgi:hypothetical protein